MHAKLFFPPSSDSFDSSQARTQNNIKEGSEIVSEMTVNKEEERLRLKQRSLPLLLRNTKNYYPIQN